MSRFLDNWTYPKHAAAVTGLYSSIALVVNSILAKDKPKDRKSRCPVKNFTKGQIIANSIIGGAYIVDMTAAYAVLNAYRKKKNEV